MAICFPHAFRSTLTKVDRRRRIRCSQHTPITPDFQGTAGVLTMASSASISFNKALIENLSKVSTIYSVRDCKSEFC